MPPLWPVILSVAKNLSISLEESQTVGESTGNSWAVGLKEVYAGCDVHVLSPELHSLSNVQSAHRGLRATHTCRPW